MQMNMVSSMGVAIISDPLIFQTCYNFPLSKNRSNRLHKKLINKHGEQDYKIPGAIQMHGKIYAHPEVIEKINERVKLEAREFDKIIINKALG